MLTKLPLNERLFCGTSRTQPFLFSKGCKLSFSTIKGEKILSDTQTILSYFLFFWAPLTA